MPASSILIKPASANCNMDCEYCFYKCLSSNREEYSKGFMTEETLEKLIIQAIDYAEGCVAFAFQGGEPTLAGISFFKKAVKLQKEHNTKHIKIENTIQTNGMLIDEEWAEFLSENHFLVGLSLDGPKKVHDMYRRGVNGGDSFLRVMKTVELFNKYKVAYNILSVVTREAACKASYIYSFFKKQGFSFLQFIPCMDEVNRRREGEISPYAVTPGKYGDFLCNIFDLWYQDYMNGADINIRMFSNAAQMAAGYPAEECGMEGCCSCYFAVEGDGSVYPCDFYCTDYWKLGTVDEPFEKLRLSEKAEDFIRQSAEQNEKCRSCPHISLCRGGCRRWRENSQGGLGLNRLCEAYEIFFDYAGERIRALGEMILKRYGKFKG